MRILLTGANGQLGRCFQDRLPSDWELWATDTFELDITDESLVHAAVEQYKPDVIVNAAAYTAVDNAENDIPKAVLVNEVGPKHLATAAEKYKVGFIHVSTDYVFDGYSTTPYSEHDLTNPLGVYGKTKLAGEAAVLQVHPEAIIIRTAWVFSEYGNNFVKTMIKLGSTRDSLGIVSDQYGCPTYAGDIAQSIIDLISFKAAPGIYHFCGDKEVSWFEFADKIFKEAMNLRVLLNNPVINGLTTEQYPTLAKRPKYSVLDCSKIRKYNILPSDWQRALLHVLRKI
ncbi:dTDP-4-dehydrorhamnose reductase [Klebsiella huaxiensis]|uniref:dTDP-4-dehydrorhamnose reductase n=1 Tax=Klebsiella huaxiensis TaxID=2153354 RepID=UPI00115A76ED|nr:dTDP-4-dehydrorhamnose reductase [Klebsiella huaxiensis]VUS83800.1 dTDP-4-dehydrorhamnose reductase [Klebsiella huaxiensis]